MDFLRAGIGIVVTIALAFILGWTRNVKHPATHLYTWIFAIAVLLLLRFYL